MSSHERIISALAPAVLLMLAALVVGISYALRVHWVGHYADKELDGRETGAMISRWTRLAFAWFIQPFWRVIFASQLPASAITGLSLIVSVGAGVTMGAGRFALGGWLFLVSGILDIFDGRMARALGTAGPKGAALDSIFDRYSDAVILIGLSWYYRESWVLAACLVTMAGSSIVPYVRAKGESLGVVLDGGLLSRPARVVLLGFSVALSPIPAAIFHPLDSHPMHWLAVGGIVLVGIGSNITAILRMTALFRFLDKGAKKIPTGKKSKASILRSGLSSGIATSVDAASVLTMVTLAHISPWLATIFGCAIGALINFTINRGWVFDAQQGNKVSQMRRYSIVWGSSALLNGSGVALLLMLPGADYRWAWLLVRATIFLGWNYPLQRDYVFSKTLEKSQAIVRTLVFLILSFALASSAAASSTLDSPTPPLEPNPLSAEAYTETWSTFADLDDGTYVQLQLAVSNAGPGSRRGRCSILVAAPDRKLFRAKKKINAHSWHYKAQTLFMGPCTAQEKNGIYEVRAKLHHGKVSIRLESKLNPRIPPGGKVQNDNHLYTSTILIPWATASVDLDLKGWPKAKNLKGMGYADHSRTTTMPADLAQRWVRLRLLKLKRPLLALLRFPPNSDEPVGWTWKKGQAEPVPLSGGTATQTKKENWLVTIPGVSTDLSQRRLIYRHAPIEDLGFFGKIVKAVVGNPVTYTYRIPGGIMELTNINE